MARRIPDSVLDEIRGRADIIGLVGEYVTLKKSGQNYKGLCPFHQEKTPSFNVSPERDIFHCFGCGAGGNVFTFLMRMEGMDFLEAVRHLALRTGVEVPTPTVEESARASKRERLFAVTGRAASLYHRNLLEAPEAEVARDYLAKRGFVEADVKAFELGYAPQEWDFLLKKAQAAGVSAAELEACGLVVRSERGKGHYDRFRGRLIFPIRDHRGEVVGFGGRVLDPEAKEAKYINTPETALYSKGRLLYGMDKARKAAQDLGELMVTEGYFDVITAHHFGSENIVATLGTALTEQHARLIARYANRVALVFDADQAGLEAARRGADLLVAQGIQVEVLTLPAGEDPDSYIRSEGPEAFEAARKEAKPLVEFMLDHLLKRPGVASAAGKGEAASEVLQVVDRIPNRVERDEAFRRVAEALGVREEALRDEFRRLKVGTRKPATARTAIGPIERGGAIMGEELLVSILLQEMAVLEDVVLDFNPETLRDEQLRAVCVALFEAAKEGKVELAGLLDRLPSSELAALAVKLAQRPHGLEDFRSGLQDCLEEIGKRTIREEVLELERALKEAEAAGREAEVQELLMRRIELQRATSA
jgi:DNA primase